MKIESHKMNIRAKSKIGSLDNVGLDPPNSGTTNGHKVRAEPGPFNTVTFRERHCVASLPSAESLSQTCATR